VQQGYYCRSWSCISSCSPTSYWYDHEWTTPCSKRRYWYYDYSSCKPSTNHLLHDLHDAKGGEGEGGGGGLS